MIEKILLFLVGIVLAVCVFLMGSLLYSAIDNEINSFDVGIVVDKHYQSESTVYQSVVSGKTTTIIPVHYPEEFIVTISNGSDTYYKNVPYEFFDEVKLGYKINIKSYEILERK